MKRILWLIPVLVTLFLWGCMITPPSIEAEVDPPSGRLPCAITIAVTDMERGTYTFEVAGAEPYDTEDPFYTTIVSEWPWRCAVTWTGPQGRIATTTARFQLENKPPFAHFLWTWPNAYHDRERILIDLRYLEHGCTNGLPVLRTGIEDRDYTRDGYSMENDDFMYRVEIEDIKSGIFESVFSGPNQTLIGNEYTEIPIFYWFVNWGEDKPPYPYAPWLGCEPIPDPPFPPISGMMEKRVHVYTKEWNESYHWVYTIWASPGGCG